MRVPQVSWTPTEDIRATTEHAQIHSPAASIPGSWVRGSGDYPSSSADYGCCLCVYEVTEGKNKVPGLTQAWGKGKGPSFSLY